MLQDFGADIEVAGAEFVEQGDALVAATLFSGYLPRNLLTKGNVQAELSGHELVVVIGIAVGLRLPEFMTIDGVQIDAGGERLNA